MNRTHSSKVEMTTWRGYEQDEKNAIDAALRGIGNGKWKGTRESLANLVRLGFWWGVSASKAGMEERPKALLVGIGALTCPDFHQLNKHAGRNDRLLHAVLCAYAKHVLDNDDIGWKKLGDILHDVLCNEFDGGPEEELITKWAERIKEGL